MVVHVKCFAQPLRLLKMPFLLNMFTIVSLHLYLHLLLLIFSLFVIQLYFECLCLFVENLEIALVSCVVEVASRLLSFYVFDSHRYFYVLFVLILLFEKELLVNCGVHY